jgi:chemotaxis protein MotB
MDATTGIMPYDTNKPSKAEGKDSGGDKSATSSRDIDLQFLSSVAKDFFRLLNLSEDLADKPVDIQVTSDGLRITLYDRARRPLFVDNTADFTEWGRFVMQSLAWMIDRQGFHVVIEGHTRSGIDLPKPEYTSWELSTDRANASRRALTFYAVDPSLIERVTGYSDTRPMPDMAPESESNQRVTLSLTVARKAKAPEARAAVRKPDAAPPAPPVNHDPAPPESAPSLTPPPSANPAVQTMIHAPQPPSDGRVAGSS